MKRTYGAWLVSDTSTQLGSAIRSFCLPVLVVLAGGTNTQAGTLRAVSTVIVACLALFGGVLVDRYDRRRLLRISTSASLVIFGTAALWLTTHSVTWGFLMVIAIATAIRSGTLGQTSNVLLRDVVPEDELPRAMSINQGRDATIEIVANPIGGFLIARGAIFPFLTEVMLNAIALAATYLLPAPSRARPAMTSPGRRQARGADSLNASALSSHRCYATLLPAYPSSSAPAS